MIFEHAHLLWFALVMVPAMIAFYWWAARVKRKLLGQFIAARLLANLTVGVSARRQRIKAGLLVAAVALVILALARPQIGFSWEEARSRGLDIVVAIDTSKSMLATDVAPNRLRRAQLAAMDLKRLARTDRLGLVAFAGSAFLQCPLTLDDEAFRQSVEALDVNIIPQGGSALSEAIAAAKSAFKKDDDNHKVLVLFTDGEDNEGSALEAAKAAGKDGLRIFTIGVGTANGELLRVTDTQGRTEFIKDENGNVVKSRLNEALLREMAQETGGFYMLLSGANTMNLLYERGLAPLPKSDLASQKIKRPHERYQWLLGLAIALLLAEMLLPDRKATGSSANVAAPAGFKAAKTAGIGLLLLLPALAWAGPGKALKLYQDGKFREAQEEYERLLRKGGEVDWAALKEIALKHNLLGQESGEQLESNEALFRAVDKANLGDVRLHFNAGTAAYQAGDLEAAEAHFVMSMLSPDLKRMQQAFYNLGNTYFRFGEKEKDIKGKMGPWEAAIRNYEAALKLDPNDADAEFNRDFVKKKLEELKQQQQQQQDKNNKDDKKDQKDQSKQDQQKQKEQQSKDQQKKDQQNQQGQQNQKPEDQQQQDQQKQQEQASQQDKKKEEEKKGQQASQKPDKGEQQQEGEAQPQGAKAVQMTPQQAIQLLEALKSEEKVMPFRPILKTNRQDRIFKDW